MDVLAQTASWNFSTPEEYTYDSDQVEVTGGEGILKNTVQPGVNWIENSGGNSFVYRKAITIDNTQTNLGVATETLTDFTVLVELNSSNIDYSKIQSEGQDIRFTDSNGVTTLNYEIESWNPSGSSYLWVRVPEIDTGDSDYIYIYYGNASAESGQNPSGTWGSDYSAVYHLKEQSGSTVDDSTANAKDGSASVGATVSAAGKIGNARSFAGGSNSYIATTLTNGATITVSAWAVKNSNTIMLFNRQNGGGPDLFFYNNKISWNTWNGDSNPFCVYPASINDGQFHHYTAVIANGATKLYYDGVLCGTANYANPSGSFNISSNAGYDWNGKIDEMRVSSTARSAAWAAATYKSETNDFLTFGQETSQIFSTSSPTITPVNSQGYSSLSAFTQTLGDGSTGEVKYQISPDDGSSWYWYTGGAWTQTSSGVSESNTASTVNDNIASFDAGEAPKKFLWRAYLVSDGSQQPKLDLIELTHVWDTAAPDEVLSLSNAKNESGGEDITSNNWYNSATPYFTWDEPDDNAGEGESESGIDGYYVYFGPSATADPTTAGSYQSSEVYTASVSSSGTYYLFIETKDVAGNINHVNQDPQNPDEPLFIYKYDSADPTSPLYVSSSPSGYSRTNSFTFSWPTTGASMAQDTGGSLLSGYQYKINSSSWSNTLSNGSVTIEDQGETGVNIFYLRAIDNAGNYDDTPVQTNFYYNASAPTAPRNLSVDPSSSINNSFSFSWDQPSSYNGSIDGYYYSINAFPTLTNTSYTQEDSLEAGPYATQQGENTFYIVAKDEAGNYDFASCNNISGNTDVDGCAKVVFTANTSAPGIPTGLSAFDISNRDTQEYATTLKWTAPQDQGTGFDGYEIYRSANGTTFTAVGSTSGTTYADTDLDSRIYYYFVKAKDNAGQYSSASTTISITPTGRYTTAPDLTEEPVAVAKAFSCNITWETDRDSSSFIYVDEELGNLSESKGVGQPEKTSKHSVDVTGLEPQTTYYYQAMWEDVDGNQGRSEIYSFQTSIRPAISNVKFSSITLNSAILSWDSSTISSSTVNYGKTSAYGSTINENSSSQTTSHTVFIQNLDHSSTYHVQITATDTDNNSISSDNYTFDTLPMPKIENLRFESVQAATTTVRVVWKTNVETSSEVVFSAPSGTLSRSDTNLSTDHELIVDNLADSSVYSIVAKGRDQFGNQAQSDVNSFTTPIDTRAPSVYDIVVETSNVGSGREDESQVLVSWRTDEPATSRVEYGEGISGDQYESKTTEDAAMTNSHLVVVSGLSDSSPYHLRVCSKDKGANETCSTDNTIVPGESKKSLFSIIVGTFKRTFGWLEKLM